MKFIKRISVKKTIYLLAAVGVIFSSIYTSPVAGAVNNETPVTIANVKAALDKLAKAEVSAYVTKRCFKDKYNYGSYWGSGWNYENVFEDFGMFYGGVGNAIGTGAWLEKKVQGEVDDGKIWCSDGSDMDGQIIKVFGQNIGIGSDLKKILCNGSAHGIVQQYPSNKNCGDSSAEYQRSSDWEDFARAMYNNYVDKIRNEVGSDEIGTKWDDLGTYGGVSGYALYVLEIDAGCGTAVGTSKSSTTAPSITGNHMSVGVADVNEYGEVIYQWFDGSDSTVIASNSFVVNDTTKNGTCKAYADRVNNEDIYGKYKTAIQNLIKKGCMNVRQEQLAQAEAKYAENEEKMTEEAKEKAKEAIDAVKALGTNPDNYVEDRVDDTGAKTGGLVCKSIEGFADVVQGVYEAEEPVDIGEEDVSCYNAGGSLGWILCPILEFASEAADTLYTSVVEPYLVMDANLFKTSAQGSLTASGDKTYEAWQTFQGIANTAFVIFFIFVIFSQITGVGIDNYGIKKILPKLITAAILINLSYIICVIAVDVSNIVGAGIKGIFDGLIDEVTLSNITVQNGNGVSGLNTAITSGVAILTAVVGAVALYTNGAAILIPLLISALSVLMAIFFIFILLSLRKAAVIILIVVSPVAFGCYMLPNTKKYFDKWLKALQGMLFLYPIAGALVGGGNYVSKLLLSTGNGTSDFFFALSAMVIGVLPIFFIPTLLKGSFAAIGNIGARLSNIKGKYGGRLNNKTREKLEQSRLTNGRNYRQMMRADARKARQGDFNLEKSRRTLDRLGNKSITKMSSAERSRLRAARGVVDSENRNVQSLYESSFSTMSPDDVGKQFIDMSSRKNEEFDANMATAAISAMGTVDQNVMLQNLRKASKTDAWKNMSDDDRIRVSEALRSQKSNAVAQAYGRILGKGKSISLDEALVGEYTDASGEKHSCDSIAEKIGGMDSSVLANQDKDTLKFIQETDYGTGQNLINAFNSEQVGQAIATSDGSSDKGINLQNALTKRTDLAHDISSMSTEQFSGSKAATIKGAITSHRDADAVKTAVGAKVDAVKKDENLKGRLDVGYESMGAGGAS